MINYDHIMVRFGELNTKGKNKKEFIKTLYVNIQNALKDFNDLTIEMQYDHIYIGLNNTPYEGVLERFSIVAVSTTSPLTTPNFASNTSTSFFVL